MAADQPATVAAWIGAASAARSVQSIPNATLRSVEAEQREVRVC
jgi:hypothetical protein